MVLAKNCQHGTPCGNSCISPGKVCKAGGGVDPQVDQFFVPDKYPEFAAWKPEMTDSEAASFVENSKIKDTLHHVTLQDRAAAIRQEGVDTTRSTETVFFAAGHYMAKDVDYARDRFGDVVVAHKALIKNPREFKDQAEYESWKISEDIASLPDRVHAKFARAALLEQGFDGLHILEDTPGIPNSESWLAFHPKQVVSLPER